MNSISTFLARFFGVILKPQTYLNALYLLIAFPLGLFYFIFLVMGLSLGIGLAIIWIGLAILLVVLASWYAFIALERQLAIWLLREEIPPMVRQDLSARATQMSAWERIKSTLSNPVTWKGLIFLVAKFPIGIISFVTLVTCLSVSAALIGAPFYYNLLPPQVDISIFSNQPGFPGIVVDTPLEAGLASLIGLGFFLVSLHIFNGLAWFSGKFARVMLGNFQPVPVVPVLQQPVGPQIYQTADTLKNAPADPDANN